MTKQPKPSQPAHGKENPSAHRSFHPDEYAPDEGPGRTVSKDEAGNPHGKPAESRGARGEDQSKDSGEKGMHDLGPRGRSQRPSGTKDASASTGVDPQDPPGKRSGR